MLSKQSKHREHWGLRREINQATTLNPPGKPGLLSELSWTFYTNEMQDTVEDKEITLFKTVH
jgi:hypothetical protein